MSSQILISTSEICLIVCIFNQSDFYASLYYPVLLLYFQMCRIINLLVMVIVRLPPLQCKFLKGRDFFDSFIDMLSTIKEYLAHSRCSVNNNGWRRDGWILVRCEGLGHGIKISPLASAWVHGWMVGASWYEVWGEAPSFRNWGGRYGRWEESPLLMSSRSQFL